MLASVDTVVVLSDPTDYCLSSQLLHTLRRVPDLTSKKSCRNLPLDETMIANINAIRARSQNRLTVKALALAYEDAFGQKISHATLCRYNKRSAETVPTVESSAQISQQATSFDRQQPLIDRNMLLLDPSDMMGYHPNLSSPSLYMPISSSSSPTVQQHGVPDQIIYNAASSENALFPVNHQSFHNTHNASYRQINHH